MTLCHDEALFSLMKSIPTQSAQSKSHTRVKMIKLLQPVIAGSTVIVTDDAMIFEI
jgi:hypothetical protein